MHSVAEAEQIFGEIGAVLPGDAGEERHAPLRILSRHVYSNDTPGLAKGCPTTPNRSILHITLEGAVTANGDADRANQTPSCPHLPGQIERARGLPAAAQAIAFDPDEV